MRAFLRGFCLALLSLVALAPIHAQTAASQPPTITSQGGALSVTSADSVILTVYVELSRKDEVRAVLEDSDEMLRVEIEQRAIGTGHGATEPKVSPKAMRNLRPSISPPLLV